MLSLNQYNLLFNLIFMFRKSYQRIHGSKDYTFCKRTTVGQQTIILMVNNFTKYKQ